jgi:type IV secretory pathway TrbF-like protein
VAKPIASAQQSSPKEESVGSPYLVARKEWDERYGGLIKRAQQWRGTAVLALLVALFEAVVIIGVATRPRTAPYVVAVDSLGRVAAAGAIDRTSPIDERMKRAAITPCIRHDWQSERGANNRHRLFPRESTLRAGFARNGAGGSEHDLAELTAQL